MSNKKTTSQACMHEKIAIVGIACRLPGGIASLDDYWRVLSQGQDVVTEISNERFGTEFFQHPNRKEAGKSVTFSAGVLHDVEHFDAAFFGISPREAEQMDPQQRLLLELAWEALENGGQIPDQLAGSDCAVYVGIASTDYLNRRVDDPASMDAYTMTGNTASIASNRISYILDLHGPSVSVDTACSSSLVAVHQACQAIRSGEASMAIAGGVNMLLHPFAFVGFSQASMLSARGRCRTFDASGDGYVRAEGAAVLFLKPLAQAEADGDPIHAVIVNSGINADGKTNGITVPSYNQQGKLLRRVYSAADVDVNDLVYLEAHGTGTSVGDPIETRAIGEVLGQARHPDNPLLIGSAKSNLGHLETASGMAGLLKAVLTLEKQALPPSIHVETFNPKIDFAGLNLKVVTELTPLKATQRRQLVGINSFGFGGANAHVLIESYKPSLAINATSSQLTQLPPLLLSARGEPALKAMASQYAELLTDETKAYEDIAWSLAKHRTHLPQGLVVAAPTRAEAIQVLQQYAEGKKNLEYLVEGRVLAKGTPLALVFSGNGSQWQGMGAVLFEHDLVFRAAVEEVEQLLNPYVDYSLIAEFKASAEQSRLHLTEIAQPLLFALQVGLVRVLQAAGIKVYATLGHSVGEVAAAWAAGALSLEQAVRVIYERSHAQGKTRGQGRMAAASLGLIAMQAKLKALGLQDKVEIAGINSPNAVTLSASLADLEILKLSFEQDKVFFRILDLDYAFHSHWMDSTKADLLAALEGLQPVNKDTGIQFISTVYGRAMAGSELTAEYWWNNIRQPVAFEAGMNLLLDSGVKAFLEIGPHPILRSYIKECMAAKSVEGLSLGSDQRHAEQALTAKKTAYSAWLAGGELDLSLAFPAGGRFIPLPNYPWQRERYWYPLTNEGPNLVNRQRVHPLLGYRLKDADATWENQLDTAKLPYLADHIVDGAVIVPAAAYVEMALAASAQWQELASHTLENFEIHAPIMLEESIIKLVRFSLQMSDGSFTITSRDRLSDNPWTVNVVGRLTGLVLKEVNELKPVDNSLKAQAAITAQEHYQLTEAVGLTYLAAFQGVKQVWVKGQTALADLQIPESLEASFAKHLLHPALLDAGFQVLVDIFREDIQQGQFAALIPIQITKLNLFQASARVRSLQVKLKKQSPRSVLADFVLWDEQGELVAELLNCRFRAVQFARTRQTQPELYEFIKIPKPLVTQADLTPAINIKQLIQAAEQVLEAQEANLQRQKHFTQIAPLFDVLATAFVWEALQPLLASYSEPVSLQTLQADHALVPEQQPLLQRLLNLLEEDCLAEQTPQGWQLAEEAELPSAQDIWLAILGDSPAHVPELVLLGRCGEHLLEVLQGKVDPASLLLPAKSSNYEHWLDSSPSLRASNLALAAMLKQLVSDWPVAQRLRILELSGERAALTQLIVPVLSCKQVDYCFTDRDASHLALASEEFKAFPNFTTQLLSPEFTSEQAASLVQEGKFDLVVCAQTLENWGDLDQFLPRLSQLAKPNALILFAQAASSRFLDLTQGLQPHWWLPVADETGQHFVARLHTPQEWQALLAKHRFDQTRISFEPYDQENEAGAFIVAAQLNTEIAVQKPNIASQSWLILADELGYSADLASALQDTLMSYAQQVTVQTEFTSASQFDHIIHLQGLCFNEPVDLLALQEQRCISTLGLVQALDKAAITTQLWLVTAGAMEGTQPAQAPLWGLGRVLMNEHPDLKVKLIDLQKSPSSTEAAKLLVQEYLSADAEDEVLISTGQRQALRLHQTALLASEPTTPAVALDFTAPGLLKHLYWRALPEQVLQADEIEILPKATGLNFRDVMYAMGLLSDEAVENGFAGASLGMELSGVVQRVGRSVTDFKVGDAVIGFAPACFSTRVITRTTAVAHKPSGWSDEEAATVPTTFFTVYYALQHLAQLEPGERILIHGASGGVGLAAIQYARYKGAEIFATAGTDEKRDFVRLMGADHVLDSRSLKFAEDVMRLSQGQGVDVVLNSISGEAINRNLSILRPFGRFLELGKRDFYENSKIGLRPFRNNISYFGIDADQLLIERPQLAGRLFQEMMSLFQAGVLRPLPHRVFTAQRIQEAFRYMQQSRQIGKVIVSFETEQLQPSLPVKTEGHLQLKAEASYLITGGLSGFGLKTAIWLAEKGAKTLVLLSRSGQASAEDRESLERLTAAGVQWVTYACDVTDKDALADVFAEIQAKLPPLTGIIHAAMVLDDIILRNMSADSFRKVSAPKMLGAWHLHELTEDLALDFFVMYSSITTYLGNPGQANYVAANLFLESLAEYRRQQGLPASFAAWGPIADAGYLTRNEAVKDALQSRLGGAAITTAQALTVLEQLLQSQQTGVAVVNWDWSTLQRVMPNARSAKFSELQHALAGGDETNEEAKDIHELVAGLSPEATHKLVTEMLLAEVGHILRLPNDKLSADKSVFDLGMDSLMGMELVLAIEERFKVRLPVMALTEGATVSRIAEKIVSHLHPQDSGATPTEQELKQQSIAAVVKKHGSDMTDAELAQLAANLSAEEARN
ncbi:MAG: SDR family NAD(P)-dependent oxidoreductase [Thiothrix sp.]|nr:MAG: SDR family NAD(P)-dependent oxidoreductase [Thiothrix sp.]